MLLAPIVTQLVTQLRCQTLKRNLYLLTYDQRLPDELPARTALRAASSAHWLLTFDGVLCLVPRFPDSRGGPNDLIHSGMSSSSKLPRSVPLRVRTRYLR